MDHHQRNHNELRIKRLTNIDKKSNKLSQCSPKENHAQKVKSNFDKDTLNLFKGIVKIKTVLPKKETRTPIIKPNSTSNKNIFEFTNFLYNNEEHLYKNQFIKLTS